jgi:capsular exopolysaccharide synthesis family protein
MSTVSRTLDAAAGSPVAQDAVGPFSGVDEHLVTLVSPTSFEAEQFLALRHHVEHARKDAAVSIIAVSSPGQGDGKTLTAINLAGALAQGPKHRVLLVDADFRAPMVAARLGMEESGSPGLAGALLDPGLTLADAIRVRMPFILGVLPAGGPVSSPYEVLNSPRLGELLDAARQRYDFVILDTPPLVPFPDCRAITRWIDGMLLVVAAGRTPRPLLVEALGVLDRGKILGLIWNNDEYRYTYRYGYRYGFAAGRANRGQKVNRLA